MSIIFEFPFSRYIPPYFFRRFDTISYFLLHGSTKGLNYRVQRPCCAVKLDLSILFQKKNFKNFLGPFPSPWGAFALNFRIPLLTLLISIFFPNFRPFFTLPSSGYPPPDDRHAPSTNRGAQPAARRPYMANILYYTLNFTSTVSPSP